MQFALENPTGTPATPSLGKDKIEKLLKTNKSSKDTLVAEIKDQRIADENGAIGWKVVKQYKGPKLGMFFVRNVKSYFSFSLFILCLIS